MHIYKLKTPLLITCLLVAGMTPSHLHAEDIQIVRLQSASGIPVLPENTAVVFNSADKTSVKNAELYAVTKGIPYQNLIGVALPLKADATVLEATKARQVLLAKANNMKAIALVFDKPSRVGGHQSITSFMSMGPTQVRFKGSCNPTDVNPVYGSLPGISPRIPLSMMVVAGSADETAAFIKKSININGSDPQGTVYLLKTKDSIRSGPRESAMRATSRTSLSKLVKVSFLTQDTLKGQRDVFGYQTGLASVSNLGTLRFVPGAYADHLTSYGGRLHDSSQMSILAFMKAGATGSFGTVREPCNYSTKFPNPQIMFERYVQGDTLVEAYWKSVAWVTEGLFIGDPLARPFMSFKASMDNLGKVTLSANRHTKVGRYTVHQMLGNKVGPTLARLNLQTVKTGQKLATFKIAKRDVAPVLVYIPVTASTPARK